VQILSDRRSLDSALDKSSYRLNSRSSVAALGRKKRLSSRTDGLLYPTSLEQPLQISRLRAGPEEH